MFENLSQQDIDGINEWILCKAVKEAIENVKNSTNEEVPDYIIENKK